MEPFHPDAQNFVTKKPKSVEAHSEDFVILAGRFDMAPGFDGRTDA